MRELRELIDLLGFVFGYVMGIGLEVGLVVWFASEVGDRSELGCFVTLFVIAVLALGFWNYLAILCGKLVQQVLRAIFS